MKKFSWIFALILALSIGFIGCPSDDDGDDTVTPPVDPGFVPNPAATTIPIIFGDNNTEVTAIAGSVVYINGNASTGSGYQYTYGSGANTNYGNALVKFSVNLGDFRLGDYGGIEFKWEGVSGDVGTSFNVEHKSYTKNLFVLATVDMDTLSSYQSDGNIKGLIANTNYFVTTPTGNLYDGAANVPAVKGGDLMSDYPAPYTIATPFTRFKDLTGEIYLSFYHHATDGVYKITDVKLVKYSDFVVKSPPPAPQDDPPPEPIVGIPEGYISFELDLSDNNYTTPTEAGINDVKPTITGSGPYDVTFTQNNQRLIIALTDEQKAQVMHTTDKIVVLIDGVVKTDSETTGNSFRLHLADKESGSGWGFTTNAAGGDPGVFADKLLTQNTRAGWQYGNSTTPTVENPTPTNIPNYFILQHRNAYEITITLTKITIGVKPNNIALTAEDVTSNATVTIVTGGFNITNDNYGSFATFKVTLPEDDKLSDYYKLLLSFKGVAAGADYKEARVLISEEEPTSVSENGYTLISGTSGALNAVYNAKLDLTTIDFAGDDSDLDLNEFFVSVYFWGAANSSYDVTDIAFY